MMLLKILFVVFMKQEEATFFSLSVQDIFSKYFYGIISFFIVMIVGNIRDLRRHIKQSTSLIHRAIRSVQCLTLIFLSTLLLATRVSCLTSMNCHFSIYIHS
jgi:hypothetical protein